MLEFSNMEGKVIFQGKTKKGLDLIIRYPAKEDAIVMMKFINEISKEKSYIRFQGETITVEVEQKYLENFISKIADKRAVKLLAFAGDQLIGIADINGEDKVSSHVAIFGLIVAQKFRRKGVGSLLTDLVIKEAASLIPGLRIVTLGVFANNPAAIGLYTKSGFAVYGKLPKGIFHRGEYVDHWYMYKNIQ